ncbi:hypothetical protein ACHAXS_001223 [Conticribra weissflogii]
MTLAYNMSTKRMQRIYQTPSKTITKKQLIGLADFIVESYLTGTTKTDTLTSTCQDISKGNSNIMNTFKKDHLKIVHTQFQPRGMEKLSKIPSLKTLKTRKNQSDRYLQHTLLCMGC